MQVNKAQQVVSENRHGTTKGLRVLAKIIARLHTNKYWNLAPTAEMESKYDGEKDETEA